MPKRKILVLSAFIMVFLAFLYRIDDFRSPIIDESHYLYVAWQMSEGSTPYRDFYFAEPPILPFIYMTLFKSFGVNVLVPRLLTAIVSFSVVLQIFWIGTRLWNVKAGMLAALILTFDPNFFLYSRTIDLEIYVAILDFLVIGYFLIHEKLSNLNLLFISVFLTLSVYVKIHSFLTFLAIFFFVLIDKRQTENA
ncbi:MAG: glycosyltransferase family 39 protein [Candidatus Bathyarchaeia archaeon]